MTATANTRNVARIVATGLAASALGAGLALTSTATAHADRELTTARDATAQAATASSVGGVRPDGTRIW